MAYSPEMGQPDPVRFAGWVIVITTIGLLCVPWTWHRRFARWVVPPVLRYMKLYGLAAAVLGALVLWSVFATEVPGAM